MPVAIDLPDLGLSLSDAVDDVVGELGWASYLMRWGVEDPSVHEGWGGDHLVAWPGPEGVVVLILTAWDHEADAEDFLAGFTETLARRASSRVRPSEVGGHHTVLPDGTQVNVARAEERVAIVFGSVPGERGQVVGAMLR